MAKENWEQAAKSEELKDRQPVKAQVGKRSVLLTRIGDRIYATGAKCTHYGAPLEKGVLIDHVLTCPWHNARFDLTAGTMVSPPALSDLAVYETKEEGGAVYVRRKQREAKPVQPTEDVTFVILGGGAAGLSAALTLRQEGFGGKLIMITVEKDLPYDRTALSKAHMEGSLDEKWLPLKNDDFYRNLAIDVRAGMEAQSLDTKKRQLHFTDGSTLGYDKLLIATGGVPRKPPMRGTDLSRFFLLRSLEDARRIGTALQDAREAVVIGASFIGLEVAASLRSRGIQVQVAAPEQVLMEKQFGERVGTYIRNAHEKGGVRFNLGVYPQEAREQDGKIQVALSDGRTIRGDLVIAGMGIDPAVGFLESSGLVRSGAIPVDGTLRTEDPHVYAAGDIAVIPDFITGGSRRVEHWVEAERQGRHAARSMMGSQEQYREVPFFWTKQLDMNFKYLGYTDQYDRVVFRGELESGSFMAGYYRGDNLQAALSMGMTEDLIVTGEIIKSGVPMDPKRFGDRDLRLRDVFAV